MMELANLHILGAKDCVSGKSQFTSHHISIISRQWTLSTATGDDLERPSFGQVSVKSHQQLTSFRCHCSLNYWPFVGGTWAPVQSGVQTIADDRESTHGVIH